MSTPTGLLPFDLEKALQPSAKIVTRYGREVTEIYLFQTVKDDDYPLLAVVGGVRRAYTEKGIFISDGDPDPVDLFLLPEPVKFYNKVYQGSVGYDCHPTLEDALASRDSALAVQETTITGNDVKVEIVHKY